MTTNETLALILNNGWTPAGRSASLTYSINSDFFESSDKQFVNAVHRAISAWESVANITFTFESNSVINVISTSDINFSMASLGGTAAGLATITSASSGPISHVEVQLNNVFYQAADFTQGGEGFVTILHELGHALGLSHPDDGSSLFARTFQSSEQNLDASVMISTVGQFGTYTSVSRQPWTPQVYDIAAMQHLYGVNAGTNAGDTVYTFTGDNKAYTIWDSSGIDTISQLNTTEDLTISILESPSNIMQIGNERIWFALGGNIENIDSGSGNDNLKGNFINNVINGMSGNDTISSGDGVDIVNGNKGVDSINGNQGNDVIRGGQGNDVLHGGAGQDNVKGDLGVDFIYGDKGNDTLTGGAGGDRFIFNNASTGTDIITDFELAGAGVADAIQIVSSVMADSATALAATTFSGGNAIVDLGNGNTITLTGVTTMDAGDFVII